eukprot:5539052-Amphidinium_carterae.1
MNYVLDMGDWKTPRECMHSILRSRVFNMTMAAVIVANVCVIIAETNMDAACSSSGQCHSAEFYWLNWSFLCAYMLEICMRIYAHQWIHFRTSGWNMLDLAIVLGGLFDMVVVRGALRKSIGDTFPDVKVFRLARGLRMLRAFHLAQFFPQLRFMISSLQ